MIERRTLEDVLNDLKEAEKEYKEKCLMYGITEKRKRKKDGDDEQELVEGETIEEGDVDLSNSQSEASEEKPTNNEEISEN